MFWKTKPFLVLTFLLTAILFFVACNNNVIPEKKQDIGMAQKELLIGVIPAQGSNQMKLGSNKLAIILSEKLGRKVRAEVYPDYNGVVEAMGANKVHMAYLGPLTFGDINSTSGSLIPGIALKKAGVYESQQNNKFKSVSYTGDHMATALAIQNKMQDVGAIDSAFYDNLVKDKKIDRAKFKVIWKSQALFQYPWAVIKSISEKDVKIIQNTMLAIQDPDIFNAFGGASAFTQANNEDYAEIRLAAIADGRMKAKP